MQTDYTHIIIVLDRSGSMASVKDDTIGGFNHLLAAHQRAPGKCTLSLVKFDDVYELDCSFLPVSAVERLDHDRFVPRGSTALLDAVGRTIEETGTILKSMREERRPGKVIFVIITDGQENASRRFTRAQVREMTKHQAEKYQWEFVYIGANQDAFAEGGSIGVSAANIMNYTANDVGTHALYASVARSSTKYRSGDAATMAFTAADHAAQEDAKE